jgi:hypothetical protein
MHWVRNVKERGWKGKAKKWAYWPPLGSRAVTDGSHSSSINMILLYLFVCFIGLICCIPLFQFILILVFGSLWINTFVKSLLMVIPALWHQCLKPKGPHLHKHCFRVLSFLDYILSCSNLLVFVFLIFCCNCLWCT